MSVQMALRKMGMDIGIQKYRFWGLIIDAVDCDALERTVELWNTQKERVFTQLPDRTDTQFFLVLDKEDVIAEQKRCRLNIPSLTHLTTGLVWQLTGSEDRIAAAIQSHLLFHPISQRMIPITR